MPVYVQHSIITEFEEGQRAAVVSPPSGDPPSLPPASVQPGSVQQQVASRFGFQGSRDARPRADGWSVPDKAAEQGRTHYTGVPLAPLVLNAGGALQACH